MDFGSNLERSGGGFGGSWEVLEGGWVPEGDFVKKLQFSTPKLGSMLDQKNVFFDVENCKIAV